MLGSRGTGAAKSHLLSLVGLGSVTHYCMHHSKLPVSIVRGRESDRHKHKVTGFDDCGFMLGGHAETEGQQCVAGSTPPRLCRGP